MVELSAILGEDVLHVLHEQHDMMRDVVAGLDEAALRWQPATGANSIAQLLSHALETERFLAATALDQVVARDREGAFEVFGISAEDLRNHIDATEREIDALIATMDPASWAHPVTRPTALGPRTRNAPGWLIQAVAHSREHIGQALLTRQLHEQGVAPGAGCN